MKCLARVLAGPGVKSGAIVTRGIRRGVEVGVERTGIRVASGAGRAEKTPGGHFPRLQRLPAPANATGAATGAATRAASEWSSRGRGNADSDQTRRAGLMIPRPDSHGCNPTPDAQRGARNDALASNQSEPKQWYYR